MDFTNSKSELLKTIQIPKNLQNLNDQLPTKSNNDVSKSMQCFENVDQSLILKKMNELNVKSASKIRSF